MSVVKYFTPWIFIAQDGSPGDLVMKALFFFPGQGDAACHGPGVRWSPIFHRWREEEASDAVGPVCVWGAACSWGSSCRSDCAENVCVWCHLHSGRFSGNELILIAGVVILGNVCDGDLVTWGEGGFVNTLLISPSISFNMLTVSCCSVPVHWLWVTCLGFAFGVVWGWKESWFNIPLENRWGGF